MQFQSTRDSALRVSSSEAIVRGLAPKSGLFVPESFPKADLENWKSLPYPALAEQVLKGFLTDYSADFLHSATAATYGEAFGGKAGETVKVSDGVYALELWHGPTCAFKDYALQLMPKLLVEAKKNLGRTETTTHSGGDFRRYRQGCLGRLCGSGRALRSRSFIPTPAPARSSICRWLPRRAITSRSTPLRVTSTTRRPA